MDETSSRGPLTLKFVGVNDETTSEDDDEEEEEENNNNIQTHTSAICNGNNHHLTVGKD
jgi:hypothetical protein